MEGRKIVGWNVRKLRVALGISIEELADRAGLGDSFVSKLERGHVNASVDNLELLAKPLRVDLADLFIEPKPGERPPAPLKAGRRSRRQLAVRSALQELSDEGRRASLQRVPGSRITTPQEAAWMLDKFGAAARKLGNPQMIQLVGEMTDDFLAMLRKHAKPAKPKEQTPELRESRQHHKLQGLTRGRRSH